jgi:hypothetical protein
MSRSLFRSILAALAVLACCVAAPAIAQTSFDRPGGDYLRSPLPSGDPEDCALKCESDRRCRAWSFNYPSDSSETAVCWLKNTVPERVRSSCCVSGVRGAGVLEVPIGPMEMSTDRLGGDYRNFELKGDDKKAVSAEGCRQACQNDDKCRAFTYARAGYAGRAARCFLKNEIKPPRRKPGFISGVVR